MPQVKIETPQASLNVPSLNAPPTREFGKVGQALEGVGDTVEKSGFDIQQKLQSAQAQDASSSAYYSDKIASEQKIITLKNTSPDGYIHQDPTDPSSPIVQNDDQSPRTITQEYHEWANDRFQSGQQAMPSQVAQQMYKERAMGLFSDNTGLLQNDQHKMEVDSFDGRIKANSRALNDQLESNPDMGNFYSNSNDIQSDIRAKRMAGLFNATGEQARVLETDKERADALMRGAYVQAFSTRKQGDPSYTQAVQTWQDRLAGNDPQSKDRAAMGLPTLSTMMDPTQKAVESKKLEALLKTAHEMDAGSLRVQLSQAIDAGKNGDLTNGASYQGLQQSLVRAAMDPASTPEQKAEAAKSVGDLAGALEMSRLGKSFNLLSDHDQYVATQNAAARAQAAAHNVAVQSGVQYSDLLGESVKSRINDMFLKRAQDNIDAKKKDFADYTQSNLPGANEKMALLDFKNPTALGNGQNPQIVQQAMKDSQAFARTQLPNSPEDWRPITKSQGADMSSALKNPAMSADQKAAAVTSMKTAFGPQFPKVMDTMIKDGNLPESWRISTLVPGNEGTTQMVSALTDGPATKKLYDDYIAGTHGNEKESQLKDEVANVMKDYNTSRLQNGQSRPQDIASINGAVETYAQKLRLQDPSLNASDAAQQAHDFMIGNHIHMNVLDGGYNGSNKTTFLAVPKTVGNTTINDNDNQNLQQNVQHALTPESLKRLGVDIPKQANGQPSQFADKYLEQVSKTGTASYTPSGGPNNEPGIHFYSHVDANQGVPPKIIMRGGQPLFYPLKEAIAPPPPDAKKVPPTPTFGEYK